MGEPMDRTRRVFMKLGTFEETFPTLEDAVIEFTEFDFVLEATSGRWSMRMQGGLMPCGNVSCRRGGYELDREVHQMLREVNSQKAVTLHCAGDEGSPQGRRIGSQCQRSIEATIKLRWK